MGAYSVNIIGLSNNVHQFEYDIDEKFFREYGTDLISDGKFHAEVTLNKHETFIEADFTVKGEAKLTCDRSLEEFDYPIDKHYRILFKFGDTDEEMSDEIMMIHRDTVALELGQYIFEFIALAVPLKKLHPKFQGEDYDDEEGKIVYSSADKKGDDEKDDDDEIDPRWNILKNLQ